MNNINSMNTNMFPPAEWSKNLVLLNIDYIVQLSAGDDIVIFYHYDDSKL